MGIAPTDRLHNVDVYIFFTRGKVVQQSPVLVITTVGPEPATVNAKVGGTPSINTTVGGTFTVE